MIKTTFADLFGIKSYQDKSSIFINKSELGIAGDITAQKVVAALVSKIQQNGSLGISVGYPESLEFNNSLNYTISSVYLRSGNFLNKGTLRYSSKVVQVRILIPDGN
jgi:hypothetical protein